MKSFLFVFLLLFACSRAPSPSRSTLQLAFHSSPSTLDPRKSGDFLSATLICLIYEGLTRSLPNGEVELALADRVIISEDGRFYTFHLRKAYWSDGHPITANDFESSWKAVLNPSFPALASYLLFPIKNGEKCAKGELSSDLLGVSSLDPQTLQVELERPTPYFLSLTAFPLLLPVPSHLSSFTPEVTNGPFRLIRQRANEEILLQKNPRFWNPQLTSIEAIRIQIIPDENTALQMFERGELDWLGSPFSPIPPDSIPLLQNRLQFIPMAASTFIACNTRDFPFHNLNLRKALFLSLNRAALVKEITCAEQIPAMRPLPPSLWQEMLPPLFPNPDLKMARLFFKQALEELKIEPADLESIVLYYKAGQMEKRVAQALQREWEKALGIVFKIEQIDPLTYLQKLHQRNFQLALSFWIAQFHDPINLLERFRLSSNVKNYAGWENTQYTSYLEQASATYDPLQRELLLMHAEEIFAEELPILPLYHWTSPSLAHPRLKQVSISNNGIVLFERFSI